MLHMAIVLDKDKSDPISEFKGCKRTQLLHKSLECNADRAWSLVMIIRGEIGG